MAFPVSSQHQDAVYHQKMTAACTNDRNVLSVYRTRLTQAALNCLFGKDKDLAQAQKFIDEMEKITDLITVYDFWILPHNADCANPSYGFAQIKQRIMDFSLREGPHKVTLLGIIIKQFNYACI